MILNLKIVRVNSDYCDYLRKFDNKVSYNKFEKELRPFIGILFKINKCEYFAPLSSPKPKHKKMKNTVDFFKIKNGDLGAVNFNNMIPVTESNYTLVDLNKETLTLSELKYQRLLRQQLDWLNANYIQIKNKSLKLYQLYNTNKLSENIINEGLLRYLTFDEKRIVGQNIYNMLKKYGGVWITCDVTPKKYVQKQDIQNPNLNNNLNTVTSRNNLNDRFEDEKHIRSFFGEIGFNNIEIHKFIEVKDELKSFEMADIDKNECDELLENGVVAILKI